jgi:diguanylate cyclase (GGDEF)-like protein
MEYLYQFFFFTAEALLVGLFIIALFQLRNKFGIATLYISLGVFQHMQSTLASFLYFELLPGLFVSPGSAVLFTAGLFAILLVYIKEDAEESRNLVYGLIFANITLSLFTLLIGAHVTGSSPSMMADIPLEFFIYQPRVLFLGTILLVLDVFLVILSYEYFGRFIKPLFIRIYATMAFVLIIDSVLFISLAFYEHPQYLSILQASLIGKLLISALYSLLLYGFLRFEAQRSLFNEQSAHNFKDMFTFLTYRQKYEQLREKALRDPLTGLYNRGYLNEYLPQEIATATRADRPMAVLMIDIDHFKLVNDTHGHQAGDKILEFVAHVMTKTARDMDVVCRYGGEEFTIILPETNKSSAAAFGTRLQENLVMLFPQFTHELPCIVTLTIGICIVPEEASNMTDTLACADKRLYKGKLAGRNCVVFDDDTSTDSNEKNANSH